MKRSRSDTEASHDEEFMSITEICTVAPVRTLIIRIIAVTHPSLLRHHYQIVYFSFTRYAYDVLIYYNIYFSVIGQLSVIVYHIHYCFCYLLTL